MATLRTKCLLETVENFKARRERMASRVDAIQVSQARLDALRGRQQDRLLGRLDRA
jgi:hypothetical protein